MTRPMTGLVVVGLKQIAVLMWGEGIVAQIGGHSYLYL